MFQHLSHKQGKKDLLSLDLSNFHVAKCKLGEVKFEAVLVSAHISMVQG